MRRVARARCSCFIVFAPHRLTHIYALAQSVKNAVRFRTAHLVQLDATVDAAASQALEREAELV